MSKQIISMYFGIGTIIVSILYKYIIHPYNTRNEHKIDILLYKLHKLEDSIITLQQSVEDIEDRIDRKNSQVIEKNNILTNKLDDFINLSYDIYDNE